MIVRKNILKVGVSKIDVIEDVILSKYHHADILNSFNTLVESGVLEAGSFQDKEWRYKSEVYNVPESLAFNLSRHISFNDSLKAFAVVRIVNRVAASTIGLDLRYLKRIIIATNGIADLEEFHIMCATKSAPESSRMARILKMFSEFADLPNKKEVGLECDRYSYAIHKSRELPSFPDVMTYDKCIDIYFSNLSVENTLKYLPVWLWWRLTNILPMRPSQLFLLKYDCIEHKNSFDEYWITVRRIKQRFKERDLGEDDESSEYKIQIDKKTFEFIQEFQRRLSFLPVKHDFKYLFPYELYQESLHIKSNVLYKRMDLTPFKSLLKKFHKEIIVQMYGHKDCGYVKPGDTRHFAIINMFLQGYNPLSIARMAGHDSIATQEGYYNHAMHFAESYIYHLAQSKLEMRHSKRIGNILIGDRRDAYDRGLLYSYDELKKFREVEYGYCQDISPQFPANCAEDCRGCSYFIFKPAVNELDVGLQWLTSYSKHIGDRIEKTIQIIFEIGKRTNKDNVIRVDETLKSKSKSLTHLMETKAIVDSNLMEVDQVE